MMNIRARESFRACQFRPKNSDNDDEHQENKPLVDDDEVSAKSRRSYNNNTPFPSPALRLHLATIFLLILLWLPLHRIIIIKPGSFSSLTSLSWWTSSSRPVPSVDELRRRAASASVDLLLQTSDTPKVDIGDLCDVIDASIDAVGVRGLLREVFATHAFRNEVESVASERGVLPGLNTTFAPHHMAVYYDGLINDPPTGGNRAQCTGCLWWVRHWVGAAIADRLLRDGSLSLDGKRGDDRGVITDPKSFMNELHRLQMMPDSDFVTISTEHAFVWHWLAATRPGLPDGYPVDLLTEWCGAFVVAGIWQTNLDTDLGRECRHAFGHGVAYAVLRGSEGWTVKDHYSARTQFRPHMYSAPHPLRDKMKAICNEAQINELSKHECYGGSWHSITLLEKADPPVLELGGPHLEGPPEGFETIEMFKERHEREKPIRVAMLGSGIWARMSHLPILQNNPNVFETVAIWSRKYESSASLVAEITKSFPERNCTAYGGDEGLESLLAREDIDAIIMSLPIDVQPTYVFKVLNAGKHVLSEKPTAGTTKEGWDAIKRYKEEYRPKGLVWAVAEDSRYNGMYGEVARAVRETMGPLKQLDFSIKMNMDPGSPWLKTQWRAESAWGDLGFFVDGVVHHVSGLRLIATSPPVAVQANLTSKLDYMPGYDGLRAHVEYEDGAHGIFEASYTSEAIYNEQIHASDGNNGTVTAVPGRGVTYGGNESKKVVGGGKGRVFLSFARDCKRANRGSVQFNEDYNISPEQSLLDVAFLEACLESSLAGGEKRKIETK